MFLFLVLRSHARCRVIIDETLTFHCDTMTTVLYHRLGFYYIV